MLIFSAIFFSSSSVSLAVAFSSASRSSPVAKRHWMYSDGVSSRCFSRWWNACCATYARRRLGCFHTVPAPGSSSPVSSLIIVDLPAPLAPSTATRDDSDT